MSTSAKQTTVGHCERFYGSDLLRPTLIPITHPDVTLSPNSKILPTARGKAPG